MLARFFPFKERQTSLSKEVIAGATTFLTMSYIIFVNPSILAETGMDKEALIAVTCIVAAISTILMGLIPNVPIAMAPGMGLNAFFTYTIVITEGVSWQTALGIVFLAGCFFMILSLLGAREKIIRAIPPSLVTGIAVGIGLFLVFIGLKNLGVVVDHPATLVTLGPINTEVLLGLAGLFLIIVLYIRKIHGSILIGILVTTALALATGSISGSDELISSEISIAPVAFQLDIPGALKWNLLGIVFAILYIDLFDTLGTLVACSHEAGLVKKDGTIARISQMLGVDALATMLSGLLGTSPTTSYVESATGIAAGGKTGFTSLVTGVLFLIGLLFIPIIGIVPAYATAPALIIVGFLMIRQIVKIDFQDLEEAIPALITMIVMPLTFQISTGIAFGFISWGVIKLLLGKYKEIGWVMAIVIMLSILNLVSL